jgi:signal transduction histidine kinase
MASSISALDPTRLGPELFTPVLGLLASDSLGSAVALGAIVGACVIAGGLTAFVAVRWALAADRREARRFRRGDRGRDGGSSRGTRLEARTRDGSCGDGGSAAASDDARSGLRSSMAKTARGRGLDTSAARRPSRRRRATQRISEHSAERDALVRRIESLRERDRSREKLVASMAHDVQSPLVAARGHAQMIRDGRLGDVSPMQAEALEAMIRSVDRSVELTRHLVRVMRGRDDARAHRRVDLGAAVGDAVRRFRGQALGCGVRIELEPVPDDAWIDADPDALARVLDNLISNAIKFNRLGGHVAVAVRRRDARAGDGSEATVSVADTGVGIRSEDRERVFERGFRGDNATLAPGDGLGLAVTRELVQACGGRIDAESVPGQGSTFRVTLPLVAPPSSRRPSDVTSAS